MAEVESFTVVQSESAVLVEARSNVGPIQFATMDVEGQAEVRRSGADLGSVHLVSVTVRIPVASLQSGNSLYDAELRQRLDARRFPLITLELSDTTVLGDDRRAIEGDVTIHGTTHHQSGIAILTMPDQNTLVAQGTEIIDIRDFAIDAPNVLMLKFFPDVSVQFRLTATRD